jgi:transcriptional regulator GlxA family with amidase domain
MVIDGGEGCPAYPGPVVADSVVAQPVPRRRARPGRTVTDGLLPHLRRARDHMDRYFAEPLDLARLAAVAGVSKYHFVRCFEAAYGETPIRYLTRRRIERAQDLLRAANLTVTEVCMIVGYASLGSYSARFRRLVGESPTRYRDRWAAVGGPHVPGCYLFMWRAAPPGATSGDGAIGEKPRPGTGR